MRRVRNPHPKKIEHVWEWLLHELMWSTWYCTECWRTFLCTGDTQLSPEFKANHQNLAHKKKVKKNITLLHSCRQVKQNLCRQELVILLFSTWVEGGIQNIAQNKCLLPLLDIWGRWIPQARQAYHPVTSIFVSFCHKYNHTQMIPLLPDLTTGGGRRRRAEPLRQSLWCGRARSWGGGEGRGSLIRRQSIFWLLWLLIIRFSAMADIFRFIPATSGFFFLCLNIKVRRLFHVKIHFKGWVLVRGLTVTTLAPFFHPDNVVLNETLDNYLKRIYVSDMAVTWRGILTIILFV